MVEHSIKQRIEIRRSVQRNRNCIPKQTVQLWNIMELYTSVRLINNIVGGKYIGGQIICSKTLKSNTYAVAPYKLLKYGLKKKKKPNFNWIYWSNAALLRSYILRVKHYVKKKKKLSKKNRYKLHTSDIL